MKLTTNDLTEVVITTDLHQLIDDDVIPSVWCEVLYQIERPLGRGTESLRNRSN
jgi:hypothetical protein